MRRLIWPTLGVIALMGVLTGSALAAAPQNTSKPTISGKTMVGSTLTADVGSWSGNPTSYTYQWQRCNRDGDSCGNIAAGAAAAVDLG